MSARAIHSPEQVAARRLRRGDAATMDRLIAAAEARGDVPAGTGAARDQLEATSRANARAGG